MRSFEVLDLGRMTYQNALAIQEDRLERVVAGTGPETLILVEHEPILTLGANFHPENLLLSSEQYAQRGIDIETTGRGGDVTYHGPGQLVAYPIFRTGTDLHRWLRDLEEVVIRAVAHWGVEGFRFPPNTGVWTTGGKICALGIKVRRWVSMHGIALNCDLDLAPFGLIVPCGIQGHGVTSLSQETGRQVSVEAAKPVLIESFRQMEDAA